MWRGQNACSDRSPIARHTANTTKISTLPYFWSLHGGSRDWIYQASFQDTLQHSTTLKWLTMVSNLAHPQLLSCEHSQCPHPMFNCQLSSVILRVFSIVQSRNWVGSVALDLICGRAYSPAHQDKSSWAAVSCPLAIEGVQSQTELFPWLWLKNVGKFPRHDEANE